MKTRQVKKTGRKDINKINILRRIVAVCLVCAVLGVLALFGINAYVKTAVSDRVISAEEASGKAGFECVLILGCQVKSDGTPSSMLRDRMDRGIELYKLGAVPKVLVSGDNGTVFYNEVETMRKEALNGGVSAEDVFMDFAGFSTYDSVYRAKSVFKAKKVIIVTQEYHLYRALYIAEKLGLEAYGVAADGGNYSGQSMRDCREVLARDKDFFKSMFKLKPKYLGDPVPITGKGNGSEKS